jgi:hypothetical protein
MCNKPPLFAKSVVNTEFSSANKADISIELRGFHLNRHAKESQRQEKTGRKDKKKRKDRTAISFEDEKTGQPYLFDV